MLKKKRRTKTSWAPLEETAHQFGPMIMTRIWQVKRHEHEGGPSLLPANRALRDEPKAQKNTVSRSSGETLRSIRRRCATSLSHATRSGMPDLNLGRATRPTANLTKTRSPKDRNKTLALRKSIPSARSIPPGGRYFPVSMLVTEQNTATGWWTIPLGCSVPEWVPSLSTIYGDEFHET